MPQTESQLLKRYWRREGALFTEVSIGKRSNETNPRRVDGVRVPSAMPYIKKFREHHVEFRELVKGKTIEAIEVKKALNRGVIGQAIVGKHLLEIEFGAAAAVPVVVCGHGDELLQQVCARLGVKVWTPSRFLVP